MIVMTKHDNKRTVKIRSFNYRDEDGSERIGTKREEVLISAEDAERGDRLGAFASEEEEGLIEEVEISALSDDELVDWIKEEKPNAQEIMDVTAGDSKLAQRLLAAETSATGGDPRKTVVKGLEAIVSRAGP